MNDDDIIPGWEGKIVAWIEEDTGQHLEITGKYIGLPVLCDTSFSSFLPLFVDILNLLCVLDCQANSALEPGSASYLFLYHLKVICVPWFLR